MTPANRAQRRRVGQVLRMTRDHLLQGKGISRINKSLVLELIDPCPELLAFLDIRFEHWGAEEMDPDQVVRLVEDELYRAAVAADHEDLALPVILERRKP